ncbi:hypothetical protein Tco_1192338 [Tanacetum coccineum]
MQGVSKTDFENYVKANDAILRNMQNQGQGSLPSNTVTNPKEDLKGITTRSGVVYQGPTIPTTSSPQVVERRTECAVLPNHKPSIPYPSRRNDEKHHENANEQKEKFYKIFKDMSFEISFVDALTLMPKFASTLKDLIGNKEKLRSGYQQKDRKPSQNDKTEHGMEKTVQNQGQSPKMSKSESIQKNQQSNRSRN